MKSNGDSSKRRLLAIGTAYHFFAKLFFMISGYVIHVFIGRTLGPKLYGQVSIILSILFIFRIISYAGLGQTVTKFTAEDMKNHFSIFRSASRIQICFSIILCVFLVTISEPMAVHVFHDPELITYLQISALIIPIMSRLNIYQASLGGLRLFGRQSLSNMILNASRLALVIILVYWGYAVFGIIVAFLLSSIIGMIAGQALLPRPTYKHRSTFQYRRMISFGTKIMIFISTITAIMNMDLLFIKALLGDNEIVGYYGSAMVLSRIPYEIFTVFAITLLPSVSMAHGNADIDLVKKYIRQSIRYIWILLLPTISIISIGSSQLIEVFYGSQYHAAANPLSLLIWGTGFLSLFVVLSSIINGMGQPQVCMIFGMILLPSNVILNFVFVSRYQLIGAAIATTITAVGGTTMTCMYLFNRYGTIMRLKSFLRITFSSMITGYIMYICVDFIYGIGFLILGYVLYAVIYLTILGMLGEFDKEDIQVVRNLLSVFGSHNLLFR